MNLKICDFIAYNLAKSGALKPLLNHWRRLTARIGDGGMADDKTEL